MTKAQTQYLIDSGFISYGDFNLSLFFNICYTENFLYNFDYKDKSGEVDINLLQSGMGDKNNLTIKGLKFYNLDLKIMYKDFIETEKELLTI